MVYSSSILRSVFCTSIVVLCLSFGISQTIDGPKETVVLIKGEAKRVLMDSNGTILKIIKDEPHHMDGIFVDRPPIPELPKDKDGFTQSTTQVFADTSVPISFDTTLKDIPYQSKNNIDIFLNSYSANSQAKFLLKAKVDISNDGQTTLTIQRMQSIQNYIKSRGFAKSRVRFDITEVSRLNPGDDTISIALAK